MSSNDKQRDELQQQPTLPLVFLPIELAEETSLYFAGKAAAKLLRVSRSFHSLFLPRVWFYLRTFTDIKDDETRRQMLEKYGHFVRSINFTDLTISHFEFDWLPSVKRATHLKVSTNRWTTAEEAEMLMKLIKQSKMLRMLDLHFGDYDTHVKIDELAAAVNELEYLERIACIFERDYDARDKGSEWTRAANFVDLLHPSKRSKLRLKMEFRIAVNAVDVRGLAPYVAKLMAYGGSDCTVYLAHKLFGARDNDGQLLGFPQLKELEMISCCFDRENYDLKSITASRLPQLQHLYFDTSSCSNLRDRGEPNTNEHEKHNRKPEYSGYAHIIVPSQCWHCLTKLDIGIVSSSILMDIVGLNPQLQRLAVTWKYSNLPKENDASKYSHDEFRLDAILDRLPHLVDFSIEKLNSKLGVDPTVIPVTRRYNMRIEIGWQMSVTPSAVAYILQMPQLTEVTFREFVFMDVNKTLQLLQGSAAISGVKLFYWYPIEWHQDLALTMTEKMPHLKLFAAGKCPKEHRAVFKAKYEFRG